MRRPAPPPPTAGRQPELQQQHRLKSPAIVSTTRRPATKKRWILLSIGLAVGWTVWIMKKQTSIVITNLPAMSSSPANEQHTFEFLQMAAAAISSAAIATVAASTITANYSISPISNNTTADSNTIPILRDQAHHHHEPSPQHNDTPTSNIPSSDKQSRCFTWNSPQWLQGPRLSNARNSMPLSWIHDNFQPSLLQHVLSADWMRTQQLKAKPQHDDDPTFSTTVTTTILDQTLCHAQGRFRSAKLLPPPAPSNATGEYPAFLLQDWEFRLVYLAVHRLHHQPAVNEYQQRVQHDCWKDEHDDTSSSTPKSSTSSSLSSQQSPHPYEYECPNAKYLVTALPTLGMGAALRLGAVPAIFMALTTGRIPLFIMHAGGDNDNYNDKNRQRRPNRKHRKSGNNETLVVLPEFVSRPWPLASCGGGTTSTTTTDSSNRTTSNLFYHNRRDLQCVFLPTSPCVLTQDMLNQAVLVPELQARNWRRSGLLDSKLQHVPVLLVEARTAPAKFDEYRIQHMLRKQTSQLVQELIKEWDQQSSTTPLRLDTTTKSQWKAFFKEVAKRISQSQSVPPTVAENETTSHSYFPYGHRDFTLAHAALLYVLRPNVPAMQRIQQQVQRALRPSKVGMNLNAENATVTTDDESNTVWIGLPIRGSDKCQAESTCLSFQRYMELSFLKWQQQHQQQLQQQNRSMSMWHGRGKIILTTEDEEVLSQRASYQQAHNDFPLDFVVNEHDVAQGTGLPRQYRDRADDIMISSLAALQLQLRATTSVGNCCSNFYLMLLDLLRNGCGRYDHTFSSKPLSTTMDNPSSSMPPTLECLQETTDPKFHVCCGWIRTEECNAVRRQFGEDRERKLNATAVSMAKT